VPAEEPRCGYGDVVLLRYRYRDGTMQAALPLRVVHDDASSLAGTDDRRADMSQPEPPSGVSPATPQPLARLRSRSVPAPGRPRVGRQVEVQRDRRLHQEDAEALTQLLWPTVMERFQHHVPAHRRGLGRGAPSSRRTSKRSDALTG
jgi:hypothetical protein